MNNDPKRLLSEIFGFADYRAQQQAIIRHLIAGNDALVVMPTGGGKSLCYQLPSLCREGVGIVVSPLIALMADQVAALKQIGVRAAYLNSTLSGFEQNAVLNDLTAGHLSLLYIAPERLLQPTTLDSLSHAKIALFAIDEAHCVSAWGHDFRPDYLGLAVIAERFAGVPRIALTATADARTRDDIETNLALTSPQRFIDSFDRPNIHYQVAIKTNPRQQLMGFLDAHRGAAGIVYCLSRRSVDSTAEFLVQQGYLALPYHAGLDIALRSEHQRRFLREEAVIMVATIAFGMGIDKPDVRFVVHLDLPKSLEAYYQETGRAGRDGLPAQAWMVYGLQDVVRLSQMLSESGASDEQKRIEQEKLTALLGWSEVTSCRRAALVAHFDDQLVGACSGCDVCDDPPKTWDGTIVAQKFLSCVVRTGQRFGAGHIIDVLRGADKARIRQLHHDTLPTYGIGADLSELQWRSVVRQLLAQGYLYADAQRYGALRLLPSCRPLLQGDQTLLLREELARPSASRSAKTRAAPPIELAEDDAAVYEQLRSLRLQLAQQQGVPPYVIFHDASLREMAQLRPHTTQELLGINGVGQAKLERYGDAFLAELNAATVAPIQPD